MTFTISFDAFTVPAEEQYHRLKECLYRISGIQRRRERASQKNIIAARGTVISRSQERMMEQVKTSMEVTRQSILQFEAKRKDGLQNDEHQESLESDGNLQQVLNHAFKFMAIIYEYKKAGVLTPDSDSRPVKEVEVTSQRTVEIERETLACMCRAIREKETEWSSKDLSNNSKSEVVGHIVGNLSIFLTNLEANKKVRSMCPGLNALANNSYIQESGSGNTVFDFAKALHKVYQIPLLSAVNIAFETEQNCHITRNRIDLDRIRAKPKLHDSFVNGKPRFIRRAKDAQLLLCPHGTQPNNGLETSKLPSLDEQSESYKTHGLEMHVIVGATRSCVVKPHAEFQDLWMTESALKNDENNSAKSTIPVRVLDFVGLTMLVMAKKHDAPRAPTADNDFDEFDY